MPANQKTEANTDGASSGLAVGAGFGELFAPEEVAMDSPKLAWMKRHGILTWYDSGMREGFRACPAEWFAGFQAWWPDKSGIDFFAHETAHNGDSRIGEGDSEEEALANLMTCWDARKIEMKLWHAESSPNK